MPGIKAFPTPNLLLLIFLAQSCILRNQVRISFFPWWLIILSISLKYCSIVNLIWWVDQHQIPIGNVPWNCSILPKFYSLCSHKQQHRLCLPFQRFWSLHPYPSVPWLIIGYHKCSSTLIRVPSHHTLLQSQWQMHFREFQNQWTKKYWTWCFIAEWDGLYFGRH